MDEKPFLPNYDPDFCLRVAKWGAAICLAWLMIAVCVLAFVDPTNGRCPGWTIYAKDGQATSLWLMVGVVAVPAIWPCVIVLRWKRFSQKIYDQAAGQHTPLLMPKFLYDSFKPDPFLFPYNQVFVMVIVGWCLFCTIPLWTMLTNCANLPRYLGY